MQVVVGVWTFNVYKSQRLDLLDRTLASLDRAGYPLFARVLLTNGSSDRTDVLVRSLGGIVDNGNTQIWYGMQRLVERALALGAELVVLSADDIEYVDGWLARLVSFVDAAPDDVKLMSLFVEDFDYPWATVEGVLDCGGERALIRRSLPGASWAFRARDWSLIGPIPQKMPGEDLEVCQRLVAQGYRLVALDLGRHCGEYRSGWGNNSANLHPPLDRSRWRI